MIHQHLLFLSYHRIDKSARWLVTRRLAKVMNSVRNAARHALQRSCFRELFSLGIFQEELLEDMGKLEVGLYFLLFADWRRRVHHIEAQLEAIFHNTRYERSQDRA